MTSYLKSLTEYSFRIRSRTLSEQVKISQTKNLLKELEKPSDFN